MRGGIVNSFIAASGTRTEQLVTTIDASLASVVVAEAPKAVLYSMGTNDVYHDNGSGGVDVGLPAEADWKADTAYILDAINTKWPNAKVYCMDPWQRGFDADIATLKTWRASVLSTRGAWAFAGPDEAVFLKAGDNGATYTYDGIHANAAGNALTAAQWESVVGDP